MRKNAGKERNLVLAWFAIHQIQNEIKFFFVKQQREKQRILILSEFERNLAETIGVPRVGWI